MGRSKLKVSPELLRKVLELPDDVEIFGAESALVPGGGPVILLWVEGKGVPEGCEDKVVTAEYSMKSRFDCLVVEGDPR